MDWNLCWISKKNCWRLEDSCLAGSYRAYLATCLPVRLLICLPAGEKDLFAEENCFWCGSLKPRQALRDTFCRHSCSPPPLLPPKLSEMRVLSGPVSYWCVTDKSLQRKLTGLEARCQKPKNKRRALEETEQKGVDWFPLFTSSASEPLSHSKELDHSCMQVRQSQAYGTCFSSSGPSRVVRRYNFYQLVSIFDFLTYASFLHLSATTVWCNRRVGGSKTTKILGLLRVYDGLWQWHLHI